MLKTCLARHGVVALPAASAGRRAGSGSVAVSMRHGKGDTVASEELRIQRFSHSEPDELNLMMRNWGFQCRLQD